MLPGLVAGMVLHELGHAVAARSQGDHTAEMDGRITINPLKHIDPVGSILLPAMGLFLGGFLFGWAKPVPVNPRNFNNYKKGMIITALAGPAMNVLLVIISFWTFHLAQKFQIDNYHLNQILQSTMKINLILGAFNLIPLPPLDGSKILSTLLPYQFLNYYDKIEQYANFIFIFLLVSGLFRVVIKPFILLMELIIIPINYLFVYLVSFL